MRMCGHAHHDDMLYLGKEPAAGWDYPAPEEQGYADSQRYRFWAARDPLHGYARTLEAQSILPAGGLDEIKANAERVYQPGGRPR